MNTLKTFLLLGALSAILVTIGGALGPEMLVLFTILTLVMNVGAYFYSDRLVLRMHGATPIEEHELPGLHRMVDELARRPRSRSLGCFSSATPNRTRLRPAAIPSMAWSP